MPFCRNSRPTIVAALAVAVATAACSRGGIRPPDQTPLVDGHNDLLIHYLDKSGTAFASADAHDIGGKTRGQSDLPSLKAGGIGAAIFTVGILDEKDRVGGIRQSTDLLRAIAARYPADLEVVTDSTALMRAFSAGRIATLMGLEGGDQIGDSLGMVETLHRHGVRAMTLTWDRTNAIGDAAADVPRHDGLSPFGTQVVEEMNRLGMLVDLSHAAETTARDVLALTRAPVIFSHSSARALCPAPRNVSDDLLRRVAANGGVVMVTFVPYFTSPQHWAWYEQGEKHWASLRRRFGDDKAAAATAMEAWDRNNPPPVVTLEDVADHVDHVRKIAGPDHVGLGSDFDGMGSFRVKGLEDASGVPALLAELARRGWDDADLRKLSGDNFLRVLRAVETASVVGKPPSTSVKESRSTPSCRSAVAPPACGSTPESPRTCRRTSSGGSPRRRC